MNYMHQVYNDINLQKQENLTTIELEVKKSVFKHLMIEPYRVCRRVNILRDYPDDKIKIYP